MEFFWINVALSLTVAQVASLQCYSCDGERDCQETEVCEEHQEHCSTTIMTVLARPKMSTFYLKGCDVTGKPNNSITYLSGNQVVFLAEEHCGSELCNTGALDVVDVLTARGFHRPTLDCYSCSSSDKTCLNATSLVPIRCARVDESCVDITSFTMPEEFPTDEERIKGCGQLSHCNEPLGFHNLNSFYLIQCCGSRMCNNDIQDYKSNPLPLNGITCYSCEGNATHGCSPNDVSQIQCQGPMDQCLEASGIHGTSGQSYVLKGCATATWCDSPYTSVYKNVGAVYSRCCTGNLCNSQIVEGKLKPSPRSRASHHAPAQNTLLSTALLLSIAFLLSSGGS
ncbi:hypothetical protein JRQ81_011624 [Phrynocephalus forsythii]|uniref:Urokinase plasminogen activator surface receptor n=1 Tax=Phrynocephalus forsythii TaxID=171643 RepID=A0A9Q0X679_9SAUR|nr:hypothetical protein JRQ81_011624 [Phrynocephalus forsythii]